MAGIDILNIQPSQISRDLRGKYLMVYGRPKIGKTTLLSQLPNSLILAFEPGTNALLNAHIQPILKWVEFKQVLRQLNSDLAKEKYHFIGIDTADVAWQMAEDYICQQHEAASIGDIPWGAGYALLDKEFASCMREIPMLGYGICFVSHEIEKTFTDDKGEEYVQISPALSKRPYGIINKFVDIIAYIRDIPDPETRGSQRYLFFRGNQNFLAGSRFKYIEPKVSFGYENLVKAITDAVDKQVEVEGGSSTEENNVFFEEREERPFEEAFGEARNLWIEKVKDNEEIALKVASEIENIFGRKLKISEVSPAQQDLLELLIISMREL